MKVTFKETDNKSRAYPWIGVSTAGTVYIFTGWREGVCLKGSGYCAFGKRKTDINMEYFRPYDGTITLSNDVQPC